jgi:hypothetical protein
MITTQFTVYIEDKPGAVAGLAHSLAKAGVGIEGISAYTSSDVGLVQIVVDKVAAARRILGAASVSFTEQDVSLIALPHEVGSLAAAAQKLARGGVNINYIYGTGCRCGTECACTVIVSAPDLKKVEAVLGSGRHRAGGRR